MHVRAREDAQVANALSVGDGEHKSVVQLTDGQLLAVDGETIVCTPSGGGGSVTVGAGLDGDGSVGDPIVVDFSGAVDGQSLRLATDGFEGFWPGASAPYTFVTAPVAMTTTPATVLTVNLPAAGTYLITGTLLARAGTINTSTKTLTYSFAHASVTGCQIGWAFGPIVTTAGPYGYGTDFSAALPAIAFATTQSNGYGSVRFYGSITVSAGGNLTISGAMSGDTASTLAGSAVQVVRAA